MHLTRKHGMNPIKLVGTLLVALAWMPVQGWAAPILGAQLSDFAVLGASAVTNTGPTTLTGGLGVSNNSSPTGITGFFGTLLNDGPGTASGAVHQGDAFALTADAQLSAAMTSLGLLGPGTTLGADLSGMTLAPGVYTVAAGVTNLTGVLTLDGGGNANAFWVFQMPSTLITSSSSIVNVINTGAGAGVYWDVGSSATLGSSTTFSGNILASTSISMGSSVNISCGRALAHTGAVTFINDVVNAGDCAGSGAAGSNGLSGGLSMPDGGGLPVALPFSEVSAVPEPAPLSLFGAGLLALFVWKRKNAGSRSSHM
ncbi:MAG: hypothetical protein JWP38_212 [Herbaspirillum sp.]|jgi:hypothetical protein|nr:hypothetical protein [Herbaspirillum sp.]